MSYYKEDESAMDSKENTTEENGGGERTSLMVDKESSITLQQEDSEVYSAKKFMRARSFRIGLIFSLILVILIIAAIIGVAVGVVVANRLKSSNEGARLSLDNVFDSKFQSKYYSGKWANGQLLTMSSDSGVTLYDPASNETTVLISPTELKELKETYGSISSVKLSPISSQLLLVVNVSKVYRHSFLADYFLYDNGAVSEVAKPDGMSEERIQYAAWNPARSTIAYVIGYNIFLLNTSQGSSPSPVSITSNGTEDGTRHGIPDWVYEEEVISDDHALWWSPDGSKLLYASFNDTSVQEFSFPIYGPFEDVYTTIDSIPYPKPGTANPTVSLHVVDLNTPQTIASLDPPANLVEIDHYFIYTGWLTNSTPFIVWIDRTQNHSQYCVYSDSQSDCQQWHEVNTRGWIEVMTSPSATLDGSSLLTLLSNNVNEDSFTHIARVNSGSVTFLTSGPWEVTTIVGYTQDHILYISTQTSPLQRHLYSLRLTDGAEPVCLTCSRDTWELPKSPNSAISESCDYFGASCDEQLSYCVLRCYGPSLPFSALARFDKDNEKLEYLQLLEGNDEQREAIAELQLPTVEKFTVPEDNEGPSLYGKLLLPPGFSSKQKYPVLVYVYGGPNSQTVDDRVLLQSLSRVFLSSNLSMIIASVDGRGTGYHGDNFKFAVYRDLGNYETVDQLRAGKYLQSLSYVDGSKLAIYGASYGGYMAAMVGSSGAGVFSAAISQSPVSDWHYYDSIYTERYMNQPSENEEAYKRSSVLYRASHLAEVDYLLIHGTGDDNVHFQHTAQLVEALTEANVLFDMQIYTDKAHSLAGGNTQRHLYELISNFLRLSFRL